MLRNPRFLILGSVAAACALGATLAAAAAADAATTAPAAGPYRQQLLDQLDGNHDGQVSRAEYQRWLEGRFARLDGNGDGVVDAAEIANSPAARERAQRRAERFVRRFARGGSSQVTLGDFEAVHMQRFDRIGNGADTVAVDALLPRGARHDGGKMRSKGGGTPTR